MHISGDIAPRGEHNVAPLLGYGETETVCTPFFGSLHVVMVKMEPGGKAPLTDCSPKRNW